MSKNYITTVTKELGTSTSSQTAYTVPTGGKFICFKKSVTGGNGTVTILDSTGKNAVISTGDVLKIKEVFSSAEVITAQQSATGNTLVLEGVLFENGLPSYEEGGSGSGGTVSTSVVVSNAGNASGTYNEVSDATANGQKVYSYSYYDGYYNYNYYLYCYRCDENGAEYAWVIESGGVMDSGMRPFSASTAWSEAKSTSHSINEATNWTNATVIPQ